VLATVGVPADAVDENVLALGNAWLGRGGRDLSLLKIDFMLPANGVDMVVGSKSFGVAGMDPQPKAPPNDAESCDPTLLVLVLDPAALLLPAADLLCQLVGGKLFPTIFPLLPNRC